VVLLLPVLLKSALHALDDGPELSTHAARILASVSIFSSAGQLSGPLPPAPQLVSVAAKKAAGAPVVMSTRLVCARLIALVKPVALLAGAPIICPVESVNCASAHSTATVVSSLVVTEDGRALDIPATPISPIAALLPDPAFPPSADR